MYLTAKVVSVEGTEALILFQDLNIQKTAAVIKDLTVAPDDTVYVLTRGGVSNCLVIGIKEE